MMKKFWNKIRPVLIAVFWIVCAGSLAVLLGASISQHQSASFQSIDVVIDETNGMLFLSKEEIMKLLTDNRIDENKSKPLHEIDYGKIERIIETNPYVENAEIFADAPGNIHVNIKQRTSILRVINNEGVSYYIDEHACKMPLSSKFTPRVIVATGNILAGQKNNDKTDSVTQAKLFTLATFIN